MQTQEGGLNLGVNEQTKSKAATSDFATSLETKIGKYISPSLIRTQERISINQENISLIDFNKLYLELYGEEYLDPHLVPNNNLSNWSEIEVLGGKLQGFFLTEFERLTLLAFEYFRRAGVELAIVEVGMGGRLDATNILSPEQTLATAITSIGLDHQQYLGTSLEEIAREKRGIIKSKVRHFEAETPNPNQPNSAQGNNFKLALEIYNYICKTQLGAEIHSKLYPKFLQRHPGRFQHYAPKVLLDGAHNPQAAKVLNSYIRDLQTGPRIWLLAMLDKDYQSFINSLFDGLSLEQDIVICSSLNQARALDPQLMINYLSQINCPARLEPKLDKALELALSLGANSEYYLIATGSLYLVGTLATAKI